MTLTLNDIWVPLFVNVFSRLSNQKDELNGLVSRTVPLPALYVGESECNAVEIFTTFGP